MAHQPIIKREYVRVDDLEALARAAGIAPARAAAGRAGARPNAMAAAKKAVRLLSENGRVHALELSCSCGEHTTVEFEYPSESEAARSKGTAG